jgi:hypothetical protein
MYRGFIIQNNIAIPIATPIAIINSPHSVGIVPIQPTIVYPVTPVKQHVLIHPNAPIKIRPVSQPVIMQPRRLFY